MAPKNTGSTGFDPTKYRQRIVVKRRTADPWPQPVEDSVGSTSSAVELRDFKRRFPAVTLRPMFLDLEADVDAQKTLDETMRDEPDMRGYEVIDLPEDAEVTEILDALQSMDSVELAYVEDGPTPPPSVKPADDPRSRNQGFLDAGPDGIDARFAWTVPGGEGTGVGFVDLERGWTLDHEDLRDAHITLISGVNTDFFGHGTAVLGQVVAVDNATGNIGIAPGCRARVVSQWRVGRGYLNPEAIVSATDAMAAGDVLLLEAQTAPQGSTRYRPVEVEPAVFDAILRAARRGITVVEAAGNGYQDLDFFETQSGRRPLNRSVADFKDSGAIMVGAATAVTPHTRSLFSNFGSRIDCYAWGDSIDTTGDGREGNSTATYTRTFGGTSGASPIIAGAAILVQAIAASRFGRPLSPTAIRELLADPENGTSSSTPDDRVGSMPDLRAIVHRLRDLNPAELASVRM